MTESRKLYFGNLDTIRFIAALIVYLSHGVSPAYEYMDIEGSFIERILNALSRGGFGVSIFFVLSGFLITFLLLSEYEKSDKISLRNFYIRRVLRIWPLYFLVVLLTFLIYPFVKSIVGMNNPLASKIIYHLTFLSNFDVLRMEQLRLENTAMSQNITWSVSIEEQFYLFWPLIFVLLPYRFWKFAIILSIVGSIVFQLFNYDSVLVLYYHTLSILSYLAIGGLTAYVAKTNARFRKFLEASSTGWHFIFILVSLLLMVFYNDFFKYKFGSVLIHFLLAVSFALLISTQALTQRDSKLSFGHWKFANRWGKYTYGIYLLHPIALTFIDVSLRLINVQYSGFVPLLLVGIFGFVLTLIISWVSYEFFEMYFLRIKNKFATIKTRV